MPCLSQGRKFQQHPGAPRQSLSKHPRFFCAIGNGLVWDVQKKIYLILNFWECVHLPHSFLYLLMTLNARDSAQEDSLQENAWLLPKEKGKQERRKGDHKRRGIRKARKKKKKRVSCGFCPIIIFHSCQSCWQILRHGRARSLKTNWLSRPGLKASL